MEKVRQQKISEIINLSNDFILTLEEVSPRLFSMIKSEIISNPRFYELTGNNPSSLLEEFLQSHLKIFSIALKFDSIDILIKSLRHLYAYCRKKGFKEEIFKIEFMSLENSLTSMIPKYQEDIKKLYQYLHNQFEKIIKPKDLIDRTYIVNDKDEEFIRHLISELFDIDFIEAEILIKSYLIDDEKREKFYKQILDITLEIIKDAYESEFFDEIQTTQALNTLNRILSSIYKNNSINSEKSIYIFNLPIENILGISVFNLFIKLQSQIFADVLSFEGINCFCHSINEIQNINFQIKPNIVIFWGVSPFNFDLFINAIEIMNLKFSEIKYFIFSKELDDSELAKFGKIFHNSQEILEVIKND